MKNHKQLCNSQKAQFKTITIVLITLSAFFSPLLWRGAGGEVFAQNPKLDSLFLVLKTAKTDTTRVNAYTKICREYISSNPDTALYFGNLGLGLAIKANYNQGMSDCYNNIGLVHYYQGNYHKAIEYYLKSFKIDEELGNKKGISQCYNNIGIVYYYQGDYLKGYPVKRDSLFNRAIEYYLKSLKIKEELGNKKGMSACYNNISVVYWNQGDYPKATEYYLKSLKIEEELGNKKGMSDCYNNIGVVYWNQGVYPKATEYYLKSLKIKEELGDKKGMSDCYNNIGNIYFKTQNFQKAIEYYNKVLVQIETTANNKEITILLNHIGASYANWGNYAEALKYLEKAKKIAETNNYTQLLSSISKNINNLQYNISNTEKVKTDYDKEKSFEQEQFISSLETENIVFKKENLKSIEEIEKLSFENQAKELKLHIIQDKYKNQVLENKIKKQNIELLNSKNKMAQDKLLIEQDKFKNQRKIMFIILTAFCIVIVMLIFIFRLFLYKKKSLVLLESQNQKILMQKQQIEIQNSKLNQANKEISTQRDLVTIQKEHIEVIHKNVTDSINYAKRIQQAVLPDIKNLAGFGNLLGLSSYFVLFRPKDVVSGDFYWAIRVNEWLIVTVADCTGHGVPGAFMSMLGISFLNEIVRKKEVTQASQVLNHLRESVIDALKQKGTFNEQKDGMDMGLIAINTATLEMQFAGANNPLYLVSGYSSLATGETNDQCLMTNDLLEIKGDKMPVAIYAKMDNFTNHKIQLKKDDIIYLLSDGYKDQFGGPNNKKFLSKNLKQLLLGNCEKSMNEQKDILEKTLVEWIGKGEQVDDITLLGIKI